MFFRKALARASVQEAIAGYFFGLPTIIIYLLFVIIPIVITFSLSFTQYDILSLPKFIGLQNYSRILKDPRLLTVYLNTFLFTLMAVTGNVGLGLLIAMLLNRRIPNSFNYLFRFAYFIPVIISYVYVSVVWTAFYSRDTGIINYFLNRLGIESVGWISDSRIALLSIIVMDIWKNAGFFMVIFLAALQGIPSTYVEAARLDGCSGIKLFRHVIFPLLSPTVFFNIVWASIGALQVFDAVYILTQGGPGDATRSIVVYIYQNAFQKFDLGSGSAISITLFLIINALTLIQFRIGKRWVHY